MNESKTLTNDPAKPENPWLSDNMIIGYFSLFTVLLHLIAIEGFGYFRDELYYISCSNNPAFGFVDQPPLSTLLLKFVRFLLGDSVVAIRLLPTLSSGVMVFMTGLLAKELGGRRFALILACVTAIAPLGNFFLFTIYSMNFLDHLFWLALIFIMVRIIKTGEPKLWLWFGLVAGFGLQNKISILFLCFGVAVGILLTGERNHLKESYLWFGGGLALLIFLPYILWNMSHDWPLLEFMHNAKTYKMSAVSPLGFFKGQILEQNPVTFLIWLSGLWFFFFNQKGRKYRLFGWMYVAIYILFTIQQAKAYYLSPAYPILFAGGAVMVESWIRRKNWNWLKPLVTVPILLGALFLAPITLPILSQENTIAFFKTLGMDNGGSGENHEIGLLPQHYADMHGWREMAEKVAEVYNTLSPEEKKECFIYAQNYGETGAMNFFGPSLGLPPAFSGHNNHYFWPPTGFSGKVVIILGGRETSHLKSFNEVTEVARHSHKYAMPYESDLPIFICKDSKYPLEEIWPRVKHFN